jgi:monofunctional biosynthetic peptidoglycan transglycosylase
MFFPYKPKSSKKTPGRARGKSGKRRLRPLHWLRILVAVFFASTLAAAIFFRFVPPPLTPLMAIRCLKDILSGHRPKLDKDWTPLGKMSPHLPEAVIASEDQRFFDHHGFDWEAISSAFTVNGRGKRKIGASTITQQTAKNLFLWPERSWTRKGLEAYFTLLLELTWSKRRILEVYLNIIETGDGVYGAEAAARRYFQVSSARVTASQAALLAAVLPNPRAWSPANPTGYLRRRQTWILRQMDQMGPLPEGLYRGSGGTVGPETMKRRAPAAPHASQSPIPARGNPRATDSGFDGDTGAAPPSPDSAAVPDSAQPEHQQRVKPKFPIPDTPGLPFPDLPPAPDSEPAAEERVPAN